MTVKKIATEEACCFLALYGGVPARGPEALGLRRLIQAAKRVIRENREKY